MRVRRSRTLVALFATAIVTVGVCCSCCPSAQAATGDGSPADPNIAFVGRWDRTNGAAYVPNWAGAYLRTGFTGTTVKLRQRNTIDLYYSIDGGADVYLTERLRHGQPDPDRRCAGQPHAAGLLPGRGRLLHRRRGVPRPDPRRRRQDAATPPPPPTLVEFVGDSITVGTTSSQDRPDRLRLADRRAARRGPHPDRATAAVAWSRRPTAA